MKDSIITTTLVNIPQELKQFDQWVAWRAESRGNGKYAKVPLNPITGTKASVSDNTTWGTYDQAATYYNGGDADGIGFVFTDNDPFCGVDLDDCRDPSTGELEDWVNHPLYTLDSYTEVSPSGTGIKIFCKGQLDGPGRNFGNTEVYSTKRFFTLTGNRLPDWPEEISDRHDEVNQLYWLCTGNDGEGSEIDLDALDVPLGTKKLIREGEAVGKRSEAMMSVVDSLVRAKVPDGTIFGIFDEFPIGEKYREKGAGKKDWLTLHIDKARDFVPESNQSGPEEVIEELNRKHAVVMLGGSCCIMNETIDPAFNRPFITFSSNGDFKNFYMNRKVTTQDGGPVEVAKYWLESPDRRQYEGIVFSPGKEMPGYYNLFRGFDLEPKQGDWSLFREHILNVIASGDQEANEYIIAWLADLFQNPGGQRPGTAIVLRGKQGTGKGVFANQVGRILGSHFLQITQQGQITGRFNNHLKDALLVFCDEAIWAGNKPGEGVLKAMITEDTFQVEPKGKDSYTVKNHIRLIGASNSDWVVPVGISDRRFFVLDVSDAHMQDREYFRSVVDQMDNGGREAMLYDLLRYDLTGVDLGKFPQTEARLDQIIASMDSAQKFWLDRLQEGILREFPEDEQWKCVVTKDLYEQYTDYAKPLGDRYLLDKTQFGKELKKMCPKNVRKKILSGCVREWHYVFPDLQTCRKDFEDFVGQEIFWE